MLCLLLLSLGCGRHPRIAKLSQSSVVVAFGDSLTAGTGAGKTESYPSVLAGIIGCRVVNAGVPGETSSDGLRRLPTVLQQEKAVLVIICEGGNDMLRGQEDEVIRGNLNAMVSMARGAGADVILVGVPRPGLRLKAPRSIGRSPTGTASRAIQKPSPRSCRPRLSRAITRTPTQMDTGNWPSPRRR